jgi:hypothetical protein
MNESKVVKTVAWMLGAGLSVLFAVLGMYAYKFGPQSWLRLSEDQSDWSAFGSYVGGLAGPLFAFLAFMAAAMAVALQARQLEAVRAQALQEETQRILSTLGQRIEQLLDAAPAQDVLVDKNFTAATHLAAALAAIAIRESRWRRDLERGDVASATISEASVTRDLETLKPSLFSLLREFKSMAWCLERHEAVGGSTVVRDFYCHRFGDTFSDLVSLDYVADPKVRQMFRMS